MTKLFKVLLSLLLIVNSMLTVNVSKVLAEEDTVISETVVYESDEDESTEENDAQTFAIFPENDFDEEAYWSNLDKNVESIDIPEGVTYIPDNAFIYNRTIKYVSIPDTVTSIGSASFRGCISLKMVSLGGFLKKIGPAAFSDCSSLYVIDLPYSLTTIGSLAFWNCRSLSSIFIPNSVTCIESSAFEGCTSLTSISAYGTYQADGPVLYKGSELVAYPTASGDVAIPESVTAIGSSAFSGCTSLSSVIIPNSVKSIGVGAFSKCKSLTTINIPDSVTSIERGLFYECESLSSLTIPDTITSIGESAFERCWNLTSISIPASVTSVGYSAFRDCPLLTIYVENRSQISEWDIDWNPDRMQVVFRAFDEETYWENLDKNSEKIVIPRGVTYIPNNAFAHCTNIKSVIISDSVISIGDRAFYNCSSLTKVSVPDSVTSIGSNAFYGCSSLTNFEANGTYKADGPMLLKGTELIAYPSAKGDVVITEPVTSIGSDAFAKCTSLTSIFMADSVTSIGDYAFNSCESLSTIRITSSVKTIGNHAFSNCPSLTIYAEEPFKPDGWNDEWNPNLRPVIWNHRTFNITLNLGKGVSSDFTNRMAMTGDKITLNVKLDDGYENLTLSGDANDNTFTMPDKDVVIYASATPIRYSINYVYNGGISSASNPTLYTVETDTFTLKDLYKFRYTFAGWFDQSGNKVERINKGTTGDLTLFARYEPIPYTITYELDGGVLDIENPDVYTVETESFTLNTPSKTGYKFVGWCDLSGNVVEEIIKGSSGDLKLAAQYEPVVYSVVYELNGGTVSTPNPVSYTIETDDFVLCELTKTGYKFVGWFDHDGNKVEKIKKGTTGNIELFAKFELATYVIIYDVGGGYLIDSNPDTYTFETETIVLNGAAPSSEEALFLGWFDQNGNKVETIEKGSTGNITLKARYRHPYYYFVRYELNGGDNNIKNIDHLDKAGQSLSLSNPIREDYVFKGWYKEADFKTKVTKLSAPKTEGEEITVYAKWEPVSYTFVYDLNSGKIPSGSIYDKKMTVETDTVLLPVPERVGYIFDGFYDDYKKATKTEPEVWGDIVDSADVEDLLSLANKDKKIKLYARWTPITYTIRFLSNNRNAEGYMEDITLSYGESVALPAPGYIREGINFSKWETVVGGKTVSYKNLAKVSNLTTVDNDVVTLKAVWSYPKTSVFAIKYNLNGGKNSSFNPATYNIDSYDIILQDPTKTGYIFDGFYDDYKKATKTEPEVWGNKVTVITAEDQKTYNLYARWIPITYDVIFEYEDERLEPVTLTYDQASALLAPEFESLPGKTPVKYSYVNDAGKTVSLSSLKLKNLTSTDRKEVVITPVSFKYATYTITYILNGSTNNKANPKNFNVDSDIVLKDPVKNGYEFDGWFDEDGDRVTEICGSTANKTLEAIFDPIRYVVSYTDNMFGYNLRDDKYYIYSDTFDLPVLEEPGYRFDGWYTAESGGSKVVSIKKGTTKNYDLYARWSGQPYTIKFNKNGGTGTMSDLKMTYNVAKALTANKFKNGRMVFLGWNTEPDGSGISFNDKDIITDEIMPELSVVTLYAMWGCADNSAINVVKTNFTNYSWNEDKIISEYPYDFDDIISGSAFGFNVNRDINSNFNFMYTCERTNRPGGGYTNYGFAATHNVSNYNGVYYLMEINKVVYDDIPGFTSFDMSFYSDADYRNMMGKIMVTITDSSTASVDFVKYRANSGYVYYESFDDLGLSEVDYSMFVEYVNDMLNDDSYFSSFVNSNLNISNIKDYMRMCYDGSMVASAYYYMTDE